MATALFDIAHYLLTILSWVIIIHVIVGWLVALNVINVHSQGVRTIVNGLDRLTHPLYRPIRQLMPDFGGLDFSPLVILILIQIAHMLLNGAERSLIYGSL
jgi:YggT family protein